MRVDGEGRILAIVLFDLDDEAGAYAELDARFVAGEGDRPPASWTVFGDWIRAVNARDWERVASLCSDDFVDRDNRSLSLLGVVHGAEGWIEVLRAVIDLAPDAVFRAHHFVPGARGYYEQGGFYGTRDGGPFEFVVNAIVELDDEGRFKCIDLFDDGRSFESPRWAEVGLPEQP